MVANPKLNFYKKDLLDLLSTDKELIEDLVCLLNYGDDINAYLTDKLWDQIEAKEKQKEKEWDELYEQTYRRNAYTGQGYALAYVM